MLLVAIKMLLHNIAQQGPVGVDDRGHRRGVFLECCMDRTAGGLLRHDLGDRAADVWVMAVGPPAFDFGAAIARADVPGQERAEVDEQFVRLLRLGQDATVHGRGLGGRRVKGKIALVKPLVGNKIIFSRESGERKDLDVLEVSVQPDTPITVPIGLRIEVDIHLAPEASGSNARLPDNAFDG